MRCIRSLLRQDHRHKLLGDFILAGLGTEVADDAERKRTDKVDEQILHRIIQAHIQIAAKTERFAIDGHVRDVVH